MKAERSAQLRLLDLQDLDSTLDQLTQRRASLPELALINGLETERDGISDEMVFARTAVSDLRRAQDKADSDVEQVKARRVRTQQRLDQGQVSSPRELEALQHEITSLDRRIGDLEEAEIEVMEQLEAAETDLTEKEQRLEQVAGELTTHERSRDEALAGIDVDLEQSRAARDKIAAEIPADLMALYTRLRTNQSGVGAAELAHGRCGGCRLELNPADLRGIAAAADDDVMRCEECGRILVRTEEPKG
ncbi:MAG: hypothetical protein GEU96_02725 [Propionibacteriales bacterium]|nr:hypothetical protein [Propionibacteriales bacterium]